MILRKVSAAWSLCSGTQGHRKRSNLDPYQAIVCLPLAAFFAGIIFSAYTVAPGPCLLTLGMALGRAITSTLFVLYSVRFLHLLRPSRLTGRRVFLRWRHLPVELGYAVGTIVYDLV